MALRKKREMNKNIPISKAVKHKAKKALGKRYKKEKKGNLRQPILARDKIQSSLPLFIISTCLQAHTLIKIKP